MSNDLVHDQRMIRICTALSEVGFDCLLLGRQKKNSPVLQTQAFKQKRFKLFFETGKLFYFELNVRLIFYLLFARYSAICSIDCDTVVPGILAKKLRGKMLFFDAHEIFAHTPEVSSRPLIQKIWLKVEKWAFASADISYTVGAALAQHFSSLYQVNSHVIRNVPLISDNEFSANSDGEKFILYQGALNKGRGLENCILAMKELPLKLKIAGEGDLSQELRALVKKENLQDKVEFLRFVAPNKLPALSQAAWLGLNVSENIGLSYYLSLNNKFFDYMHAELPSLINAFPEYITLNRQLNIGLITNSGVLPIIQNVELLLHDSNLYYQLKANCKMAKEDFNWNKEKIKLQQIYTQALIAQ